MRNNIPGIEAEEKSALGKIGVPEKARDLSTSIAHLDEMSRMVQKENRDMLRGAGNEDPSGEPGDENDQPVGSY